MKFAAEFEAAEGAVQKASAYLVEEYARFQAIADARADISTAADRGAQEIILRHLREAFPDDAFCAEEATDSLKTLPQTGPRVWVIDPIDGTRGFAKKVGEFSIMVGFVHEGEIALGIVAQPATERVTYAVRGSGCWRRDGAESAVRCAVTKVASLGDATLTQSHSSRRSALAEKLAPARVIQTYSAGIKLAQVARGEADLYLNDYHEFHDWDICAGHILVTEAGGRVTGIRGETLVYGTPGAWQRQGLLASNGLLHEGAAARLA